MTETAFDGFAEAKKLLDPASLTPEALRSISFNPPTFMKQGHARAGVLVPSNPKGWIIRDPAFVKGYSTSDAPAAGEGASGTGLGDRWTTNYGFRFHYNPYEVTETFATPTDVDPVEVQKEAASGLITSSAALDTSVSFGLLLNRVDDYIVLSGKGQTAWSQSYPPTFAEEDRRRIIEQGTMLDLEYLFRTVNGGPQDTWRGKTSDFGQVVPTMVVVSLGDSVGNRKFRGIIKNIQWEHTRFAHGMIPILTTVNIEISRLIDAFYDQSGAQPTPGGDVTTAPVAAVDPEVSIMPVEEVSDNTEKVRQARKGWRWPTSRTRKDFNVFGAPWHNTANDGLVYTHQNHHTGMDSLGKKGDPVFSMHKGTVVRVSTKDDDGYDDVLGNTVVVKHGDKLFGAYCHLQDGSIGVKRGDEVDTRTKIGAVGETGSGARAPHLHFELRSSPDEPAANDNGTASAPSYIDPAMYVGGPMGVNDDGDPWKNSSKWKRGDNDGWR